MKKNIIKVFCVSFVLSLFVCVFTISASAETVNSNSIPTYNFKLPSTSYSTDAFNYQHKSTNSDKYYFANFICTLSDGHAYYYEVTYEVSSSIIGTGIFPNVDLIKDTDGHVRLGFVNNCVSSSGANNSFIYVFVYDTDGKWVTDGRFCPDFKSGEINYSGVLYSLDSKYFNSITGFYPLSVVNYCNNLPDNTCFLCDNKALKLPDTSYYIENYTGARPECNIVIDDYSWVTPATVTHNINGDVNKTVKIIGTNPDGSPIYDITYNGSFNTNSKPIEHGGGGANIDVLDDDTLVTAFDFITDKFEHVLSLPYINSLVVFCLTVGIILFFIGRKTN